MKGGGGGGWLLPWLFSGYLGLERLEREETYPAHSSYVVAPRHVKVERWQEVVIIGVMVVSTFYQVMLHAVLIYWQGQHIYSVDTLVRCTQLGILLYIFCLSVTIHRVLTSPTLMML